MLMMRYRHRLPAEHDMAGIRARIASRAPLWDATPGLAFKAFSVSERGRHGACDNAYASTYLWLDPAAAVDFLADSRFRSVVDAFGRPPVETWLPLGVKAGRPGIPGFLHRETAVVGAGADLGRLRAAEAETGRAAVEAGALAVVSGLDPATWHLTRFTLTQDAPTTGEPAEAIVHLAASGWAQLC